MTEVADDADILNHADALYAARSALAEAECPEGRVGVAELVRFLGSGGSLTHGQQRTLIASETLRADYQRLKSGIARLELPALAAASSGQVNARQFPGGSVHIHPSRVEDQIYVIVRIQDQAKAPHSILLEGGGEVIKRELPAFDSRGEIMLILDRKDPGDEIFLKLISDPTSTGSLLL
jgi:hypothetical protein